MTQFKSTRCNGTLDPEWLEHFVFTYPANTNPLVHLRFFCTQTCITPIFSNLELDNMYMIARGYIYGEIVEPLNPIVLQVDDV